MPLRANCLKQEMEHNAVCQTHTPLKVKSKSWLWNINHECSVLSGSYKHVIHVNIDLLHSHLPDGAGVLIYTDVMHHLLPLSLSLSGWSAVIQHAISCMLGNCFTFRSGWQLAVANRAFQSSTSVELFCLIFEWGRGCCNALQHMQHS